MSKFSSSDEAENHGHALAPPLPKRDVKRAPDFAPGSTVRRGTTDDAEVRVKLPLAIRSDVFTRRKTTLSLPSSSHGSSSVVKLLLLRHAQSANKSRLPGQPADVDPGLTALGLSQAEAVGERLFGDFRSLDPFTLTFVSSPMRRCLLTLQPAIQRLKHPVEAVLCHGACYEFGCAGTLNPGTHANQIKKDFPEFLPYGFSAQDTWDYRGSSAKETEDECRSRGSQIVRWLLSKAVEVSRKPAKAGSNVVHTLVLCAHQTLNDLLCTIMLEGSDQGWTYGDIRYRLQNASMTEVIIHADGECTLGVTNDASHLLHLRRS